MPAAGIFPEVTVVVPTHNRAGQLRSGRRLAAARTHVKLAARHGVHRAWLLAAAGLVVPGLQARRDRRQAAAMPRQWRAEAEL